MQIDWIAKLRHLLQVLGFALGIAAILYAFQPERPYGPQAAYSLAIGSITWAVIDFGREFFPSSRETGWPSGPWGVLLVVAGIGTGFLLGNAVGDLVCRTLGLYQGAPPPDPASNLRTSVLTTVLAGIVGSFYFYSISKSAYLERKMAEARRHASEARLKLMETQLEPHMLFNTLANLRALIGVDPERAQQMLDHMIAYLRATLAASRSTTHSLQSEFDRLGDYLELMKIRMGSRLDYALELPAELAQEPVPALLLQPLVENSIKHGLEPKVEGGRIAVRAEREGGRLRLQVEDSGVGLAPGPAASTAPKAPGSGFGLAQVRERLATVYAEEATMEFIAGSQGGTRATLEFPLQIPAGQAAA